MVGEIITSAVLFLVALGLCIWSGIAEESVAHFVMVFLTFIMGAVLWTDIHACRVGNREVVSYSFPAETYKLEMVVTETVTNINGEAGVVKKDTTYVLTGVEPIVSTKKDRKSPKYKTVERTELEK